jgi:hypothetical protein|tara:strand:+ start:309 stop:605 length:297 start_codon:yes stop_codon:yes gene_type:complete
MRVRISYSVEIEEVPREVVRLLNDTGTDLINLKHKLQLLINEIDNKTTNADRAKSEIAELREELAKIDYCLADSDSILQGYYATTNGSKEEGDDASEG